MLLSTSHPLSFLRKIKRAVGWACVGLLADVSDRPGAAQNAHQAAAATENLRMSAQSPFHSKPRLDANSKRAHAQLLEKAHQGRIDVYFEGDSITRRWGTSDPQYKSFLAHWNENFFGWNAGNFGWGGDTVQNVLWRLENGELDGVNPKVIVLMAGTNNLEGSARPEAGQAKVEEVSSGLAAITACMREKAPNATIILMGITPRKDQRGASTGEIINRINDRISRMADGKRIRYLNINHLLSDPNGEPLPEMTVDGLHLSLPGYQVWAGALRPILLELLGPPAQTDQAPPPTGDPSVHRAPGSP